MCLGYTGMVKRAVVSFAVLSILCGIQMNLFAAVKPNDRNADSQLISPDLCVAMQKLADNGIVKLPAGCRNVQDANFDRREMAILTLQAMKRIGMGADGLVDGEAKEYLTGYVETLKLKEALHQELKNMGMNQGYLMDDLSPSSEAGESKVNERRKFAVHGEIRYNYQRNSGHKKWDWNDSRLRARIFLEARINDNWHAFGMLEANKHFLSQHGKDDWLDNRRFYVRGLTGDVLWTAGWYGYMLAEGNIFDSTVAGVTANFGSPLNYELTAGRTKAHGNILSANVKMIAEPAWYGGGIHHFTEDDWGNEERTIWHAFYDYKLNRDTWLGLMYLGSNLSDEDGRRHGFVATVSTGRVRNWKPGTNRWQFKYYYQPIGTYVAHTMSGLAGYMRGGFRGPAIMYQRTILPNTVFNIEYYMLKELTTGDKANTWWTDITYYF